jgi:DNA-binding response OmpR family regulator
MIFSCARSQGIKPARLPQPAALLERARDKAADPFTTAVKTTIRRLRAKLGEPPVIHTGREGGYRTGDV